VVWVPADNDGGVAEGSRLGGGNRRHGRPSVRGSMKAPDARGSRVRHVGRAAPGSGSLSAKVAAAPHALSSISTWRSGLNTCVFQLTGSATPSRARTRSFSRAIRHQRASHSGSFTPTNLARRAHPALNPVAASARGCTASQRPSLNFAGRPRAGRNTPAERSARTRSISERLTFRNRPSSVEPSSWSVPTLSELHSWPRPDFEQAKFSDVAFQEGLGKEPPDVVGDCMERFYGGGAG
jgi:hypothetical protein